MEIYDRFATGGDLYGTGGSGLSAVSVYLSRGALLPVMLTYLCRMLAVMTLNIGYFLCTLAGLFIGELMVGRFTPLEDAHH